VKLNTIVAVSWTVSRWIRVAPPRGWAAARHPRLADVTRKRGCDTEGEVLLHTVGHAAVGLCCGGFVAAYCICCTVEHPRGWAGSVETWLCFRTACVHAGVQAAARMGGFLRDKDMLPVCVCMRCCEAIKADSAHVAHLVLLLFCCEQVKLLFADCSFGYLRQNGVRCL
jgi:hypothetical protein